ncbi:Basic leucine zipper 61 [Nymphaea thermarum]|nr:Basic leucine zipper 61 [Nymphaea thermarum]
MAQLPPKCPPLPVEPNHRPSHANAMTACWVDEFLDFSSARRGLHRRTLSDSVAFYEDPPPIATESFDRLDDHQLLSMFSDDAAGASNPSSPSDHNSANENGGSDGAARDADEKPEVQSGCRQGEEESGPAPAAAGAASDGPGIDPKRVKRILANRQSAQRSRVRKLQYISELERSVTSLQSEVSALSPRVAFLDHQRLVLNVDNSALKQRIAVLAQDKLFKDAHQEALKKEIERLRMVYHQQNLKKSSTHSDNNPTQDIELL